MRHAPRGLVTSGLVALLSSLLLLGVVAAPASASTDLRDKMLAATNRSRDSHGRDTLKLNKAMSKLARQHSVAMADKGRLFHTTDPAEEYLDGMGWSAWGENVGMTSGSVGDLEKAFMGSDSHRTNILNGAFDHVAIGAVRRDGYLWVTVFFYG